MKKRRKLEKLLENNSKIDVIEIAKDYGFKVGNAEFNYISALLVGPKKEMLLDQKINKLILVNSRLSYEEKRYLIIYHLIEYLQNEVNDIIYAHYIDDINKIYETNTTTILTDSVLIPKVIVQKNINENKNYQNIKEIFLAQELSKQFEVPYGIALKRILQLKENQLENNKQKTKIEKIKSRTRKITL